MVFSAQGRDEKMSMRIGTVVRGREASASFGLSLFTVGNA